MGKMGKTEDGPEPKIKMKIPRSDLNWLVEHTRYNKRQIK